MEKSKKIVIKQIAEEPMATEIIAESIIAISEGVRKLRSGRLTDKALHLLIQHACPNIGGRSGYSPISITQIRAVIDSLGELERVYLKDKPNASKSPKVSPN